MLRFSLLALLAATPALAQDITGTWRIASSETPEGGTYGGTVTIRANGDCYDVEWRLDTGDTYSGVGLVSRGLALAVAYRNGPAEGYGVVFYAYNRNTGGFEGLWCQPDGRRGLEDLSGRTLSGSHRLTAGTSTGTVRMSSYGGGSPNYDLSWATNGGDYQGFGIRIGEDEAGMLAAVWGNLEGTGVVLYSLVNLKDGEMPGWWAPTGSAGQGSEALERVLERQ